MDIERRKGNGWVRRKYEGAVGKVGLGIESGKGTTGLLSGNHAGPK